MIYADVSRSPPARVGSSFTLVLAVVTFNVTVGNELPKLNYLTLMDWLVCFYYLLHSVSISLCRCLSLPISVSTSYVSVCLYQSVYVPYHFFLSLSVGLPLGCACACVCCMCLCRGSSLIRYVITCFLFAFLSVVEYAAVNHFCYKPDAHSKVIGRHIDYFFKYSAGPLWILVVALFFLQHQLTQIIMFVLASIWLVAGAVLIANDVYKATKDFPRCIRLRATLSRVRSRTTPTYHPHTYTLT